VAYDARMRKLSNVFYGWIIIGISTLVSAIVRGVSDAFSVFFVAIRPSIGHLKSLVPWHPCQRLPAPGCSPRRAAGRAPCRQHAGRRTADTAHRLQPFKHSLRLTQSSPAAPAAQVARPQPRLLSMHLQAACWLHPALTPPLARSNTGGGRGSADGWAHVKSGVLNCL
jgi:hypothetical protein